MGKIRKNYSASFKAKVALETVKKEKSVTKIKQTFFAVHSSTYIHQERMYCS